MSAIAKSVSLVMAQSSLTTCSLKLHLIYFCNKKETLLKKEFASEVQSPLPRLSFMCKSKCQNSYNSIENIQNHSQKKMNKGKTLMLTF